MSALYFIRTVNETAPSQPTSREPIVGRWYCGMNYGANPGDLVIDGELARYEGEGVWSSDDEDSEREPDMAGYDYLQEQL
jgi:hypothetical protein